MATPAQILTNRENSTHSTGPVSVAGKTIASANSRKHGLTSKQIVLPGEDAAEYDDLRESLIKQFRPANETERTLAEEVAAGSWRLARARRHETAILKKLIGDNCVDADAAYAELFFEKPKELARLQRYVTTIERSYYRALNKLEKLQKERKKEQKESALVRTWADRLSPATPIGFVSQNAANTAAVTPAQPANGLPPSSAQAQNRDRQEADE